jgi:anthranilate phosphoribosyltransferase
LHIRSIQDRDEKGPSREMVAANAGAALVTANLAQTLGDGFELALQSIDSGKASAALAKLVEVSNA